MEKWSVSGTGQILGWDQDIPEIDLWVPRAGKTDYFFSGWSSSRRQDPKGRRAQRLNREYHLGIQEYTLGTRYARRQQISSKYTQRAQEAG